MRLFCCIISSLLVISSGSGIFSEAPQDKIVADGSALWWHCEVASQAQLVYSWRFNDADIVANGNQLVYRNGTLHIRNVSMSHVGTYQCVAKTTSQVFYSHTASLSLASISTTFSVNPSNQSKMLSDDVTFTCKVSSRPQALITWLHNRHTLTPDGSTITVTMTSDTQSRLVIKSVAYSAVGEYMCRGRNPLLQGYVDSQAGYLQISGRPDFPSTPSAVYVSLGGTAVLNCSAVGFPKPSTQWYRNSKTLTSGAKYTIYTNSTLIIKNSQSTDGDFYVCVAKNKWGQKSASIKLIVTDPKDAPRITMVTGNTVAFAGESATLKCEASGSPKPTVSWSKKIGSLPSNRVKFPFHGAMQISALTAEDSGIYVCRAVNAAGQVTRQAQLDVQVMPNISVTPDEIAVKQKQSVMFDCSADGNPNPVITWQTPSGDSLSVPVPPTSSQISLTVHPNGVLVYSNASLYIPSVDVNHHGIYTCSAVNKVATATATVTLNVQVPPVITKPPSDVQTFDGSVVVMDCVASGFPLPTIHWFRENVVQPVTSNGDFQILGNGSLLIPVARKRLNGVYNCLARNSLGEVKASAVLQVVIAPEFTLVPQDGVAAVGESVTFHCQATGDPIPKMFWQRNGKTIVLEDNMMLYPNHTLVIDSVKRDQYGQYTCTAVHKALTISHSAYLYPPDIPEFLEVPANTTANITDQVTMKCRTKARQLPEFTWYRSQVMGSQGAKVKLGSRSNSDSEFSILPDGDLVVKNVAVSDEGWYSCVAKTTSGSARSSQGHLNVQGLPIIVSAHAPNEVKVGATANITCIVSSELPVSVTWLSPHKVKVNNSHGDLQVTGESLLIMRAGVQRDWGKWTCRACNVLGCTSQFIQLNVAGGAVITGWDVVSKSEEIIITCSAVGTPSPSLIYTIDGAVISSNTKLSFARLTQEGALAVNRSKAANHVFTCSATNKFGGQAHTFQAPGKPQNLQIKEVKSDSVQLVWKPLKISNALTTSRFDVQYHQQDGSMTSWVTVAGDDETASRVVTGLTPFTIYRFRVQGVNILGSGPFSEVVGDVRTLESAPSKPWNVTVEVVGNSVKVTWKIPLQLNGDPGNIIYKLRYRKLSSTAETELEIKDYQQTEILINNLQFDLDYSLTLKAFNTKIGRSSEEEATIATISEKVPDQAVRFLRVLSVRTNSIQLAWQKPSAYKVSGYILGYALFRSTQFKYLKIEGSTVDSYTLSGLKERTTYVVKIAAYNRAGRGPFSATIDAKTSFDGVLVEESTAETSPLTTGAIVGIVAGCLAALLILFVILYIICCQCHQARGSSTNRELLTLFDDIDDDSLKKKRVGAGFVSVISGKSVDQGALYNVPRAQKNFNKSLKSQQSVLPSVSAKQGEQNTQRNRPAKETRKQIENEPLTSSTAMLVSQDALQETVVPPGSPQSIQERVLARVSERNREIQEITLPYDHWKLSSENSLCRPKQHPRPPIRASHDDITIGDGLVSQQGALVISSTSIDRGQGHYRLPDIRVDQAVNDLRKINASIASQRAASPLVRSNVDLQVIPPATFNSLPRSLRGQMSRGVARSNSAAAPEKTPSASLPRAMQDFQTQFPDSYLSMSAAQIPSRSRDQWLAAKPGIGDREKAAVEKIDIVVDSYDDDNGGDGEKAAMF